MSAPKQPSGQQLPKLIDPNNVQDTHVFANHLVGMGFKDGVVHLTFSHLRPKHSSNGTASDENVLVSCMSVTPAVMEMLTQGYAQLTSALVMQAAMSKPN